MSNLWLEVLVVGLNDDSIQFQFEEDKDSGVMRLDYCRAVGEFLYKLWPERAIIVNNILYYNLLRDSRNVLFSVNELSEVDQYFSDERCVFLDDNFKRISRDMCATSYDETATLYVTHAPSQQYSDSDTFLMITDDNDLETLIDVVDEIFNKHDDLTIIYSSITYPAPPDYFQN